MTGTETLPVPPFPRLGELVRWLAVALDVRGHAPDRQRDLDRLAREDSFDLTKAKKLFGDGLVKPLKKVDTDLADLMGDLGPRMLEQYAHIVLAIQVDALERDELLDVLTDPLFGGFGANLLWFIDERIPGPPLPQLLDPEKRPVGRGVPLVS